MYIVCTEITRVFPCPGAPTPFYVCQPQPKHTRLDLVFTGCAVVETSQWNAKRSYRSIKFNYKFQKLIYPKDQARGRLPRTLVTSPWTYASISESLKKKAHVILQLQCKTTHCSFSFWCMNTVLNVTGVGQGALRHPKGPGWYRV